MLDVQLMIVVLTLVVLFLAFALVVLVALVSNRSTSKLIAKSFEKLIAAADLLNKQKRR